MNTKENLKNIVEAILFASGDPIAVNVISASLDVDTKEINQVIDELAEEYAKRESGLSILKMNSSVQMSTNDKYAEIVEDVLSPIRSEKLTKSAIEVLSIVAYRQPITRTEIADIRGVRSDYLLNTLIKKELVKECGKKDTLGHPSMFATTDVFLRDFNLKDISQLPQLDYSMEEDEYEMLDIENLPSEEPQVQETE
ncbi:MAG: SMC-Scp complex subunit ScpB [Eubacteriales bacterium]